MANVRQESRLVAEPMIAYEDLTSELVASFGASKSERVVVGLLAQRARVKDHGRILLWPDFNENPDVLVNQLLAKILVGKMDGERLVGLSSDQIAVVSVETSGSYLATTMVLELAKEFKLARPPRIMRVRKMIHGISPAAGDRRVVEKVHPITAGGESRFLVASVEDAEMFAGTVVACIVDDFAGTWSTMNGSVKLVKKMLPGAGTVYPMSGIAKPDQASELITPDEVVRPAMAAVAVKFWGDVATGEALITANGFPAHRMENATAADFS